jgi:hypothetical protein
MVSLGTQVYPVYINVNSPEVVLWNWITLVAIWWYGVQQYTYIKRTNVRWTQTRLMVQHIVHFFSSLGFRQLISSTVRFQKLKVTRPYSSWVRCGHTPVSWTHAAEIQQRTEGLRTFVPLHMYVPWTELSNATFYEWCTMESAPKPWPG